MDAKAYLTRRANEVEQYIRENFRPDHPDMQGVPQLLLSSMSYSLLAGGKRIRPVLLLATAESLGTDLEAVMPIAVAWELVHTYSLIHDDLPAMDDDDYRRGKPTNHKVYGEAMAILAGDALLTYAFQFMLTQGQRKGMAAEVLVSLCLELSRAAGPAGMVAGQVMDVFPRQDLPLTLEELKEMHLKKTGCLIASAIRAGGILGGASPRQLEQLSQFGKYLGLAFQIQDDLLDVLGTQEKTGKPQGSDERSGKQTYVSLLGVSAAKEQVARYTLLAKEALADSDIPPALLSSLADFLLNREA